jgi:hypothetical protein
VFSRGDDRGLKVEMSDTDIFIEWFAIYRAVIMASMHFKDSINLVKRRTVS